MKYVVHSYSGGHVENVDIGKFSKVDLVLLKESVKVSLDSCSDHSLRKILNTLYNRFDKTLDVYFPEIKE